MSDDDRALEVLRTKMLDAINEVMREFGDDWKPPSGGVVAEAVVVMRWIDVEDGAPGLSFVPATTSFWATEGMLRGALRYHLACDDQDDDE